jgi:hypothetical protein
MTQQIGWTKKQRGSKQTGFNFGHQSLIERDKQLQLLSMTLI